VAYGCRRAEKDQGKSFAACQDSVHSDVSQPVLNFSQHACRKRYEALTEGTAKPTPESISNPDEKTKERIESRREKLKRIQEDSQRKEQRKANLQGNAWTSRPVKYF
jgi:hypothetical protein